jgi:hypothetical protein
VSAQPHLAAAAPRVAVAVQHRMEQQQAMVHHNLRCISAAAWLRCSWRKEHRYAVLSQRAVRCSVRLLQGLAGLSQVLRVGEGKGGEGRYSSVNNFLRLQP